MLRKLHLAGNKHFDKLKSYQQKCCCLNTYIIGVIWFLRYSQDMQASQGRTWGWWGSVGKKGCPGRDRTRTGRVGGIGQQARFRMEGCPSVFPNSPLLTFDTRAPLSTVRLKPGHHRVPLTHAKSIFCSWFFTEVSTSFPNSSFLTFRVCTTYSWSVFIPGKLFPCVGVESTPRFTVTTVMLA